MLITQNTQITINNIHPRSFWGISVDGAIPKPTSQWVKAAWAVALVVGLNVYAGGYRFTFENPYRIGDFFQEWASARNYFEGLPIYTPQAITAWHYLKQQPDTTKQVFVQINGHPPTCVLLGLPFAKLDYALALQLWNLLSLAALLGAAALALRLEFGTVRSWYWLPILTVALGNSMMEHVVLGQLGTLVLLLTVGVAVADKDDRPVLAGILLGTATAIKMFPGLLFLYFVVQRKPRVVLVGALSFVAWHLVSFGLLGLQTYEHYVRYSMPEVMRYRDWWANYSVTGMWHKLFDCSSGQSLPLWYSPTTAKIGALLTNGLLVASSLYVVMRCRRVPAARLSSFAVMITAMVLASPVAWDHYFLLLLWPILRLGRRLPALSFATAAFITGLFFLWLNPVVLFAHFVGLRLATAGQVAGPLSIPFYCLVLLYVACVRQALRDARVPAVAVSPSVAIEPSFHGAVST